MWWARRTWLSIPWNSSLEACVLAWQADSTGPEPWYPSNETSLRRSLVALLFHLPHKRLLLTLGP